MAIHEIEVSRKPDLGDPQGDAISRQIKNTFGLDVPVATTQVYQVEGLTDADRAIQLAKILTDPITEDGLVGRSQTTAAAFVDGINIQLRNGEPSVEVGFKPEMTDPRADSLMKVSEMVGSPVTEARINTRYTLKGAKVNDAAAIAKRLLINPNIEQTILATPETLSVDSEPAPTEIVNMLEATDEELMELSKDKLFLNLEEMKVIQDKFRKLERNPTDVELEHIAAAWSEHCVHKTFNAKLMVDGKEEMPLFQMIKEATERNAGDLVATMFKDNSGGIFFYEGYVILVKWETHNSPSGIDPVAGAATGVGGVIRDIIATGQGAKTIALTNVFVVAPSDMDPSKLPPTAINPDTMLKGLAKGVESYGNPMGIPTTNGSVHFGETFAAKPTVLVGAYGIVKEELAQKGEPKPGDRVFTIGGRTGRDGIHGATFSSAEMTERTATVNSAAVQLGNPIEEKKFQDAIVEAAEKGLIRALTDCGAAGFASAIGEIGSKTGVEVDIAKAPLKYKGLSPREIWISESQERMVLALDPEKAEEFAKICKRYGVEATDLGQFTDNKKLVVKHNDETVIDLDYGFLNDGLPQRVMVANFQREMFAEPELEVPKDLDAELKKILSHGNVCSKLPIVEQYDTTVQGKSALPPFGGVKYDAPNDASIITPILGKDFGMIISHGLNPILNRIDPYRGAKWAAVEAVSNLIAVGGNYRETALCGNYIQPVPDEQVMGSLYQQVKSVCDFQDAMGMPLVSGKDSMSSTYRRKDGTVINIDPVVNISTLGKIEDVKKTVSSDFKKTGSTVVLVGKMDRDAMGGSTYYANHGIVGNTVPDINLSTFRDVGDKMFAAIQKGQITAAHDVSEGGLATTIAEMCFGGDCGVEIGLPDDVRPDFYLFNETAGQFIVEVESPEVARELFGDTPHIVLGKTAVGKSFNVVQGEKNLLTSNVDELKATWKKPMQKIF